jgi:hypothetical protein
MTNGIRLLLAACAVVAMPALAASWEELRRNDEQRLAIDPASVKKAGDEVSFTYLVDFRKLQGDYMGQYRSATVKAKVRCKPKTMALVETEAWSEAQAQGVSLVTLKPTPEEASFRKVEARTSDEDLYNRVCAAPKKK